MNSPNLTRPDQTSMMTRLPWLIYKWGFVAPLLALSTIVLGSLIIILSFLGAPDFSSRVFGTLWARLNAGASLASVEVAGREHIKPGQSYVIAANHQSQFDIFVLYGFLGMDIKWVMKQELRQVPFLGLACVAMGHILIDRSNTEAAISSINNARDRIRRGNSVVFFPEGTRSRTGELKSFKKGAFRLAQELGLPVLPVAIHGTREILPSDTLDLKPGRARLIIGEPVTPDSECFSDLPLLTRETQERIEEMLASQKA
ncbi:MAG: 1-acyl-sn-glycerol-3-phosphate acyltransferase [Pseudomonadales bacterium]|nr:1-acyl-sn-glycerol-3-phosphate acyltransferase [Pseudomonadales bacterium]